MECGDCRKGTAYPRQTVSAYPAHVKRLLTVFLVAFGLASIPAPSNAAGPALVVADAPYVASGCTSPAFTYDAAPPAGYTDVTVTLSVSPTGGYSLPFIGSFDGAQRSGTINLCNVAAGSYTADMDVFACTASASSCIDYSGPSAVFFVGDRPTAPPPYQSPLKASLKASAKATTPHQRVTFKLRSSFGLASMSSAEAYLQAKSTGGWKKIRGSDISIAKNGRAQWRYEVPGTRLQVRAHVTMLGDSLFTEPVTLT